MADMNETNRSTFRIARTSGEEVAFSYCAKSDGHERLVVGSVVEVTSGHVTLIDRVRNGAPRVFILDRVRGSALRLPSS